MIKKYLELLVLPKSVNEDRKRREFILNILLVSTIAFLLLATFLKIIFDGFFTPAAPGTLPLKSLLYIDIFFVLLYILSRKGYSVFSTYTFVFLYFTLATYMTFLWGVEAQSGLIFYILVIVLSGVLISTLFAFFVTIFASFFLYLFFYLQNIGKLNPDMGWQDPWKWKEVIVISIIFGVIATICWLSNRETEKSLIRARQSEAALKRERDMLEVIVKERTDELKKIQMEKISQIYRFAEFGRLSSGFFHDLVNPLTIVSLNMERVKDAQIKEIGEAKTYLAKAIDATRRLEGFIATAIKQIKKEEKKKIFNISDEINQVVEMMSYKATKSNVLLKFISKGKNELFGDSVKFSQAVTNLVANAIDAYENSRFELNSDKRRVEIKLFEKNNYINLIVKDFGEGIDKKNLELIFEPFFTTKEDRGIGIGLSLTKDIIEKDFGGTIKVESEKNLGTTFNIKFSEKSDNI